MFWWTIICTRISCMSRRTHVAFFPVATRRSVNSRESLFTHWSSQSLNILVLMRFRKSWNQPVHQDGHDDHHRQWFLWDLPFQMHLGFHCILLIDISKVEFSNRTFVLERFKSIPLYPGIPVSPRYPFGPTEPVCPRWPFWPRFPSLPSGPGRPCGPRLPGGPSLPYWNNMISNHIKLRGFLAIFKFKLICLHYDYYTWYIYSDAVISGPLPVKLPKKI